MASKLQMVLNKNDRLRRGKLAETKSRMKRNRRRNFIKEQSNGRN